MASAVRPSAVATVLTLGSSLAASDFMAAMVAVALYYSWTKGQYIFSGWLIVAHVGVLPELDDSP